MFDDIEAVHLPIDHGTDEIEDYDIAHVGETDDGNHRYLLELDLGDGDEEKYRVDLEYGPEALVETGLVDDDYDDGVQQVDVLTSELDDVEVLE